MRRPSGRRCGVLVAVQGDTALCRKLLHRLQGALPFRRACGLGEPRADHQPVAPLHQHVAQGAKLRRRGVGLAVKPRLGIGGGPMGRVGALLLAKFGLGIVAQARRDGRPVIALEALVAGPGLDQRAVHR